MSLSGSNSETNLPNRTLEDLRDLIRYIAADNPDAAERLGNAIIRRVEGLKEFPKMGRTVPEVGNDLIREIILAPYRVVYELDETESIIAVIRVWHGARGKPEL